MNKEKVAARRDEVLFAFHQECEHPTAEQIIDWTKRYPEFAEDIRAHAAVRLDWAAMEKGPVLEPDEELLVRGRSRALNAIHNAQKAASGLVTDDDVSFATLATACDVTLPQVARTIDIERTIIADMAAGRGLPPIPGRLLRALAEVFGTSSNAINTALARACASPRLGHAKARQAPTVIQRSCEELIRSSGMPPERISFWLEED